MQICEYFAKLRGNVNEHNPSLLSHLRNAIKAFSVDLEMQVMSNRVSTR